MPSLFEEPVRPTGIFRIGTSGWSYPPNSGPGAWTGILYPWTKSDELKIYSRYFNTVEVNSTFYRPCHPKTAEGWAERTPDDFQFTVKAWQRFTHYKDDQDAWLASDVQDFKKGIAPLREAKKLGCLLFQFPASFRRTPQTVARLTALLSEFSEHQNVVELRHRSWNETMAHPEEFGAAVPAFIDEPKFPDSIRQKITSRAGILYMRMHGRRAGKWWNHEHRNERYDYLYSKEELHASAVQIKEAVDRQPIQAAYIFFNNHPEAKSVANAIMMRAELDIPIEAKLPESFVEKYPDILD